MRGGSFTRSEPETVKLTLEVQNNPQNKFLAIPSINPFADNFSMLAGPGSISGFDCLMVNVTGDGIPSLDDGSDFNDSSDSNCTYPGVLSNFLNVGNASAELEVPTGSDRLIQVIGFQMPGSCPIGSDPYDETESSSGETMYVIGSATTDLFGDTSVGIANEYESGVTEEFCAGSAASNPVPMQISGLSAWYDASYGVDVDGANNVTKWSTRSSYANDLTPGATAPKLATVDGYEVVDFSAGGEEIYRNSPVYMPSGDGSVTLVAAFKVDSATTGDVVSLGPATSTAADQEIELSIDGSNQPTLKMETGASNKAYNTTAVTTGNWFVFVGRYTSGGDLEIYVNGKVKDSYTPAAALDIISDRLTIGYSVYTGAYFDGWIGDVIIYNEAISDTDVDAIECYLSEKYPLITLDGATSC